MRQLHAAASREFRYDPATFALSDCCSALRRRSSCRVLRQIEALQTIPLMCFGSGEMSGYENPDKEIAKIATIKRKYSWRSLSIGEISLSGRRKERNRYEPPRPLTVRVGRRTVRTSNAALYLLICADRQHRTFRCVENK